LIYQNAFERVEIEKLHGRKGTESFQKDYLWVIIEGKQGWNFKSPSYQVF
jgi:hypothetical protein